MRETKFIDQNKEKWNEYESILKLKDINPDKLKEMYTQITDDLSFARTYYPNRSVRVYLNSMAQNIFLQIEGKKKIKKRGFKEFWVTELPQLIYEAKNEMILSLVFFTVAVLIGVFSSYVDPEFPKIVLGDSYVKMTEENIQSGDPMKVYSDHQKLGSFLGITVNNIRVSFLAFSSGILAMIGTFIILMFNGIMLGSFQFFFYQKGLFWESFSTIWLHGTTEISCIVLAGGAGLVMGRGWIFPGTFTRLQSFQMTARRGVKIMMGIVPLLIIAGFVEAYFTGHNNAPFALKMAIIIVNFLLILGYFVVYPIFLARKYPSKVDYSSLLKVDDDHSYDYYALNEVGAIFQQAVCLLKKYATWTIGVPIFTAIIFALMHYFFNRALYTDDYLMYGYKFLFNLQSSIELQFSKFLNYPLYFSLFPTVLMVIFPTIFVAMQIIKKELNSEINNKNLWFASLFFTFSLASIFWLGVAFGWLISIVLVPLLSFSIKEMFFGRNNLLKNIINNFQKLFAEFANNFGLTLLIILLLMVFNSLINSSITTFLMSGLRLFLDLDKEKIFPATRMIMTILNTILFMSMLIFSILCYMLLSLSQNEIFTADRLLQQISQVGVRKKIKGLLTERHL